MLQQSKSSCCMHKKVVSTWAAAALSYLSSEVQHLYIFIDLHHNSMQLYGYLFCMDRLIRQESKADPVSIESTREKKKERPGRSWTQRECAVCFCRPNGNLQPKVAYSWRISMLGWRTKQGINKSIPVLFILICGCLDKSREDGLNLSGS